MENATSKSREPAVESTWSLAMAVVWIIKRSHVAVSAVHPEKKIYEVLKRRRKKDDESFADPISADPIEELKFAFNCEQLTAAGRLPGQTVPSPIPRSAWTTLETPVPRDKDPDIMFASRIVEDDIDDSCEELMYEDVRVPRNEVIAIWNEVNTSDASNVSYRAPTLPACLESIVWDVEMVLALVSHGNLQLVRSLALDDKSRPRFYGKIYESGFIDAQAENKLRQALIEGKIKATIQGGVVSVQRWWTESTVWNLEKVRFLRDDVLKWIGVCKEELNKSTFVESVEDVVVTSPQNVFEENSNQRELAAQMLKLREKSSKGGKRGAVKRRENARREWQNETEKIILELLAINPNVSPGTLATKVGDIFDGGAPKSHVTLKKFASVVKKRFLASETNGQ